MGNQLTAPVAPAEALGDLRSVTFKDSLGAAGGRAGAVEADGRRVSPPCSLPVQAPNRGAPPSRCPTGGGRLFKSAVCVHDDGGLVVVKVSRQGRQGGRQATCTSIAFPFAVQLPGRDHASGRRHVTSVAAFRWTASAPGSKPLPPRSTPSLASSHPLRPSALPPTCPPSIPELHSTTTLSQVYSKRSGEPPLDLRAYKERLLEGRSRLAGLPYPHAWPVQRIYESERAVFLVRQFLHANLAQRVSTRPFLTLIEKVGGRGGPGRNE